MAQAVTLTGLARHHVTPRSSDHCLISAPASAHSDRTNLQQCPAILWPAQQRCPCPGPLHIFRPVGSVGPFGPIDLMRATAPAKRPCEMRKGDESLTEV